jgi:hypothetical protein
VILHAFGECAVLELMYAALIRAAERWLRMTEFERRQLIANRNELDRAYIEQTAPAVNGKRHRIPNSFIQQESELTSVNSPCQQLPRAWGSDGDPYLRFPC